MSWSQAVRRAFAGFDVRSVPVVGVTDKGRNGRLGAVGDIHFSWVSSKLLGKLPNWPMGFRYEKLMVSALGETLRLRLGAVLVLYRVLENSRPKWRGWGVECAMVKNTDFSTRIFGVDIYQARIRIFLVMSNSLFFLKDFLVEVRGFGMHVPRKRGVCCGFSCSCCRSQKVGTDRITIS